MTRTIRENTNPAHTAFYVSAIDGPKTYLVAGPYDTHQAALDRVEAVRTHADQHDPRAHFMFWGTCSLPQAPEAHKTPLGQF
jgi:hypothetical protein